MKQEYKTNDSSNHLDLPSDILYTYHFNTYHILFQNFSTELNTLLLSNAVSMKQRPHHVFETAQ